LAASQELLELVGLAGLPELPREVAVEITIVGQLVRRHAVRFVAGDQLAVGRPESAWR